VKKEDELPRQAQDKTRKRKVNKQGRAGSRRKLRLPGAKNGIFFECFPYVCPEPVLAK
jgi:hypothetical protein